ncbi:biotin--[acetyl-CoA-carboxylase] ligase [Chloroflexota bacterium]
MSCALPGLADDLKTRFVGKWIVYHERLPSTMVAARREVKQGAREGMVVIAGEQTEGRGRRRRHWLSPRGNVALSIILYPEISHLPSLIMLASLAVVRSVSALTGLNPRIKWPNDVLIGDRKLCGILAESSVRGDRVDYAIIGIGLNVNLEPGCFPEIAPLATSLYHELGRQFSLVEVIRGLLVEVEKLYLSLKDGGPIYEEWRKLLVTLGQRVQVKWGDTVYEGTAEAVARDGSLLLRHADGSTTRAVAGEVTLH